MDVITHRGLEPSKKDFYPEGSYAAFRDHINRGFGIEFDVCFFDDKIRVSHDSVPKQESPVFEEILDLVRSSKTQYCALHLKGKFQNLENIERLTLELKKYPEAVKRLVVFDVKPIIAKYLRVNLPEIGIAASVSHKYDIKRYNSFVYDTLLNLKEILKFSKLGIYDWAWLDEWDLKSEYGIKKFYTKEVFNKLRENNLRIALVTPELHGTSPRLLGGEKHEDSENKEKLFIRINEIISLGPDLICTDYPEEVRAMILKDSTS